MRGWNGRQVVQPSEGVGKEEGDAEKEDDRSVSESTVLVPEAS